MARSYSSNFTKSVLDGTYKNVDTWEPTYKSSSPLSELNANSITPTIIINKKKNIEDERANIKNEKGESKISNKLDVKKSFDFSEESEKIKESAKKYSKEPSKNIGKNKKQTLEEKKIAKDNLKLAKSNLSSKDEEFEKARKEYQNKLSEEYKKNDIDFQNKFDSTVNKKISYQTKDTDKIENSPKIYDLKDVNKNAETERKNVEKKLNDLKLAQYQYDSAKVDTEDTTMTDKTIGNVVRGIKDLGSVFNIDSYKYTGEDGKEYFLPTYNQLKQEKVSGDYNSGLGKILGDATYNATKILGSTALDTVTGGVGGKALYWTDMASDNFQNVKNQGYDDKKAIANTLVSTGAEYLTGKLIGSATKGLTGGKTSNVSNVISNTANKIIKNPKFANIIGNAGSEAIEEFTQEYIDNINRLATLENSTDVKDYANIFTDKDILQDALYSAGVGAISGGSLSTINNQDGKVVNNNVKVFEEFKNQLESKKATLTNQNDIAKYDEVISNIDNYLSKPFTKNSKNITDEISNNVETFNLQNTNNNKNSIANTVNAFNLGQNTSPNLNSQNSINPSNIGINNTINNTNFSKQIDEVINGQWNSNNHLTVLEHTPKVLQQLGVKDLPITLTERKLERIMNNSGKQKGEYHGLGEIVKRLPEAIENPLDIIKSHNNSYVLTTDLSDNNDRSIIVSIKIDGKGYINDIEVDTNVMTSAYGRNNYDNWMANHQKEGNIVYDIDRGFINEKKLDAIPRLQLPSNNIKLSENNISQSNENVKSDISTTNNMQKSEKNTPDELYENKVGDDVLVIKDAVKNQPLSPKTTSDEINYVLSGETGRSKFYDNVTAKSKFITEENRHKLSTEKDIEFYDKVTNKESLSLAQEKLDNMGESAIHEFFNSDKQVDSTDVATGWILLKRFQDVGDYDSMVSVAKRMRQMGTKAGQAIQMYNVLSRLTPEGMVKYAQSELSEAYDKYTDGKNKKWIDDNREAFDLTPEETQYIVDTMKKVETMKDGREKTVEIAKIQKMLQNKLPPSTGAGIKSWMRISMLFNPKTQVRNVMGNAVISPVNMFADAVSAIADKQIAKKTGIRTIGTTKVRQYAKGMKKGLFESYDDFKQGINTRDVNGNRFEVGEGKSFNENHKGALSKTRNTISKGLNTTDRLLGFVLDAGDRGFYEASFTNSINNQLILNNTTEVTQDMIDIATQEALSRTWQDNNNYTKFVLDIRRGMNKLNVKGYGLGDVLIPFAKTPANLTKAIVDYSPVGLTKTLVADGKKLKNSFSNGQYDSKLQHQFVQNLGKATAGTMLYILGYALAQANIISGSNDEDKDVSNFMKNTLGIQSYSVKIGNHSFTYDWAQPVAAPFAIMADLKNNSNEEASLTEQIASVMDTGFNILLEQSFMSSIQDVLGSYGSKAEAIGNQVLGLPARMVPTFLKQINDMIDGKTRMVYENGKNIESGVNQVKTKTPGVSKSLPVKRDTLGREVEKYGGENNVFNVFINPANTSKGKSSESAKEIYKIYKETGDKTIMPREPASILKLSNEEKSEFLKISGGIVEENVKKLKTNNKYKKLNSDEKAEAIKGIVDYAYNKAKSEVKDTEIARNYKTINKYVENGGALYDFYASKVYKNRD